MDWKQIVGSVAPGLATALGGPVAGLAVAELSKALLGRPDASAGDVEAAVLARSPDLVAKLREADNAFQVRMRELSIEEAKVATADTADARAMNGRIQEADKASTLAKNAAYVLDFVIVVSTISMIYLLLIKEIPMGNKELAYIALGAMLAHCGTILNFHRGTSSSSRAKDVTIDRLKG